MLMGRKGTGNSACKRPDRGRLVVFFSRVLAYRFFWGEINIFCVTEVGVGLFLTPLMYLMETMVS